MPSPLPLRPSIDHTPRSVSVIDLAAEESGPIVEALGSTTARSILTALADDPATVTDLADTVGTSVQNVQYHVAKLRDAGLITVVGTWYSSKGKEMRVYAPTSHRLELCLAPDDESRCSTERENTREPPDDPPHPIVT